MAGLAAVLLGGLLWQQFAPRFLGQGEKQAPAAARPLQATFGLHANRQGTNLQISWNPGLAAMQSAPSGVLKITEGDQRFAIPLSKTDLVNGRILYPSQSKSLRLELSVETPTGPETETVQLIVAEEQAPAVPRRSTLPAVEPRQVVRTPDETQKNRTAEQTAAASPGKTFTPPAPSPRVPQLAMPAAVDVAAAPDLRGAPVVPLSQPGMTTPVPPPPDQRQIVPPGGTRPPSESRPPAASSTQAPALIQAALPVKQVQPQVPKILGQALLRSQIVEVMVGIDAKGSVTSASSRTYTGAAEHLARLAVEAARSWKFQPARRNGQAISSELVIRFTFDKPR